MGSWQCIGTFGAGLALEDAGMKDKPELTSTMDMSVAAAAGERDISVDEAILSHSSDGKLDRQILLNDKLTSELRPTLFLSQLSNLLAGNISIVHKVTGSSRTFLGEEGCREYQRSRQQQRAFRAGQSTHALGWRILQLRTSRHASQAPKLVVI
ncbi:MAG: hypothetical protein U5K75_10695 [Ahrensia sp.]|nr:hypothetical protein [Ahrensia sp.]